MSFHLLYKKQLKQHISQIPMEKNNFHPIDGDAAAQKI